MIHSFWVPEFGQKQDAVPGLLTKLVITPKRLGTFPVICTELCGLGHALMRSAGDRAETRTSSSRGRRASVAAARPVPAASGPVRQGALRRQRLRRLPHLQAGRCQRERSGRTSIICARPRRQAGQPLEEFIRQSIVDPNAYVAPGYPKGVMPETFSSLPKQQLDALVKYLPEGSK